MNGTDRRIARCSYRLEGVARPAAAGTTASPLIRQSHATMWDCCNRRGAATCANWRTPTRSGWGQTGEAFDAQVAYAPRGFCTRSRAPSYRRVGGVPSSRVTRFVATVRGDAISRRPHPSKHLESIWMMRFGANAIVSSTTKRAIASATRRA
jgi:hypothetical protein